MSAFTFATVVNNGAMMGRVHSLFFFPNYQVTSDSVVLINRECNSGVGSVYKNFNVSALKWSTGYKICSWYVHRLTYVSLISLCYLVSPCLRIIPLLFSTVDGATDYGSWWFNSNCRDS